MSYRMSKFIFLLCICYLSFHCGPHTKSGQKQAVTDGKAIEGVYQNPLPVAIGDPYVLHDTGSVYYMYGTGGGAKDGFPAFSSQDLVNWKHEGQVFRGNSDD